MLARSWGWNSHVPPPSPASGCPSSLSLWFGVEVTLWGLSPGTVGRGREVGGAHLTTGVTVECSLRLRNQWRLDMREAYAAPQGGCSGPGGLWGARL